MRTRVLVAVAIVVGSLGLATPVPAAGGKGASACSSNGRPDGNVDLADPSTHDNPGEVASYLNPSDFHVHIGPSVSATCRPDR